MQFIIRLKWATDEFVLCTFINECTILLCGLMVTLYCTWNCFWVQIANCCVAFNVGRSDTWKKNNNRSQYVERISVELWNLPCCLQAVFMNASLRCTCGKMPNRLCCHRCTGVVQFVATGWRRGCSNLQIFCSDFS